MTDRPIAAVLWDMDGTLIDSEPTWIEAQSRLTSEYGGAWSYEDGLALVGADMEATARAMQEHGVGLTAAEIVSRLTREVTQSMVQAILWRAGAVDLVRGLREGRIPRAIVTTSPWSMAEVVVGLLPDGAIAAIVAGEHVANSKPAPDPYLLAARKLNVDPRHCVAIEDSAPGLASAIAAGTIAIGVPHDAVLDCDGTWTRLDTLVGVTVSNLIQLADGRSGRR